MLLFEDPKSYAEMTKKISYSVFLIVCFGLFIISQISSDFADIMKTISFKLTAETYGLKLSISLIYIPIAFSTLENMFHLHDRLSDIFGIRYRYDKKVIIGYFLKSLNMNGQIDKVNRKNRDAIMNKIFYQYVSSTSPQIDTHLIYLALGSWAWYWILFDTLTVVFVTGILMLVYKFTLTAFVIFISICVFIFLLMYIKRNCDCKKYSIDEVDEILSHRPWKRKVVEYLQNALSGK